MLDSGGGGGGGSGLEMGPRRSSPGALVAELASVGLKRIVLVGDSLARYIFAGVVGTYCGQPLDPTCNLTGRGPSGLHRTLHVDGTTVAYFNGVHGAALRKHWQNDTSVLIRGFKPTETHVVLRMSANYSKASYPYNDTAARTEILRGDLVGYFENIYARGMSASLMSPTPVGYGGQVEYNPLGDRNDGPAHTVLLHELACALDLPVVDLWPLVIRCETQGRNVGENHMNVHNCLPSIPEIEWQLVLRFLGTKAFLDRLGVDAPIQANNSGLCRCLRIDLRTCGIPYRLCADDKAKERAKRAKRVAHSETCMGMERRLTAQLTAICAGGGCGDVAVALQDPHLVKTDGQPQRSCVSVCI